MKTIGSHPGAILFRLGIMIILIAILMMVFFSHVEETEKALERTSILQTRKVINSSLAVVFATYAVEGRLQQLDQLDGSNPFEFLREFDISVAGYVGVLDRNPDTSFDAGWYYLQHRGVVLYKSRFIGSDEYFAVVLEYDDVDSSGSFDAKKDHFRSLRFNPLDGNRDLSE